MPSDEDILEIANKLLQPKGIKATNCERLQSLWAGYGHILRLTTNSQPRHLILKYVTPPSNSKKKHDEGHLRKVISYQAEQYFYQKLAPSLPKDVAVATCFGSINESSKDGSTIALVLSDLSERYPVAGEKRGELSEKQVYGALDWLARFHGFWWKQIGDIDRQQLRRPPLEEVELSSSQGMRTDGVWLNGGYTYLATRRKEYASLENEGGSEWSKALCQPVHGSEESIAELVARALAPSTSTHSEYETMIHGDVKSENLFTTPVGTEVAFFDFQYVGLGLGVCDLAKLFTCSVPLDLLGHRDDEAYEMEEGERKLLQHYQSVIEQVSGKRYPWEVLEMHWKTALVDWLRFQASWGFWGNTEWLEARVRAILRDDQWLKWIDKATQNS